jgi:predicted O-linked N-acetylglucosamine transferase (SPINDLY family)
MNRLHALGMAHARAGRLIEALAAFRNAIRIAPQQGGLHYLAGTALGRLGRWDEAVAAYRAELAINSRHAGALAGMGMVLARRGQPAEAMRWLREALAIAPNDVALLRVLGGCLIERERPDEAILPLDRALEVQPGNAAAWSVRGLADMQLGRVDAALQRFKRALELGPSSAEIRQQWLYALQHRAGVTRRELLEEHRAWVGGIAGGPVRERLQFPNDPDPERRPRVGIVSRELSRGVAATLTLRAFEALAALGYSIACFCLSERRDEVTERFRRLSTAWHDMQDAGDAAILEAIERERIDIMFDLAGPTRYGCLPLFARRAAPVQVSWAGYVGTTGLATMDALIADPVQVPTGEDADYVEQVLRLPDCYVCFDPPEAAPTAGPLPMLANGHVTFGCFNRAAKLNVPIARLWGAILRGLPGSRLLLARGNFGPGAVRDEILARLTEAGVPAERIEFLGTRSHAALLEAHGRVDVMLDPQPYSGGVMTLEALWMGVPTVTWPGETFAGRHAASHLHAVGLREWVAPDAEGYVRTAVSLVGEREKLRELRAGLRERVAASPLCDGKRFADRLEPELRRLWRRWCEDRQGSQAVASVGPRPNPRAG